MKYQEGYVGTKAELSDFIKKVFPELFAGKLVVEGQTVRIPSDHALEYKVKYDSAGAIGIKISWEDETEEEEQEFEI
ncbi:MAG: transcription initiation factor IIE [Clostridia bacterium BRH_c25]|nr:MAG: transcription initiation factor IIE [Clostridia bacterium BRH_c25]